MKTGGKVAKENVSKVSVSPEVVNQYMKTAKEIGDLAIRLQVSKDRMSHASSVREATRPQNLFDSLQSPLQGTSLTCPYLTNPMERYREEAKDEQKDGSFDGYLYFSGYGMTGPYGVGVDTANILSNDIRIPITSDGKFDISNAQHRDFSVKYITINSDDVNPRDYPDFNEYAKDVDAACRNKIQSIVDKNDAKDWVVIPNSGSGPEDADVLMVESDYKSLHHFSDVKYSQEVATWFDAFHIYNNYGMDALRQYVDEQKKAADTYCKSMHVVTKDLTGSKAAFDKTAKQSMRADEVVANIKDDRGTETSPELK